MQLNAIGVNFTFNPVNAANGPLIESVEHHLASDNRQYTALKYERHRGSTGGFPR